MKDKDRPYFYIRTLPGKLRVHELDQEIIWEGKNGSVRLDNITSQLIVIANGTQETFEWKESRCKVLKQDGTVIGDVELRSHGYSDFYNIFRVAHTRRPYRQSRQLKSQVPWYDFRWCYYLWIDV